jgi:hypothetical protein
MLWLGAGVFVVGVMIGVLAPFLDVQYRQTEMEALKLRTPYSRSPIIGILGWILRGGVIAMGGVAIFLVGLRCMRRAQDERAETKDVSWSS